MSNDNKKDAMQDAMSQSIPKDPAKNGDDQMTEAMKETRVGAHANKKDKDAQTRAMSNEFELTDKDDDAMTEAMKEKRKNVKK